MATDSMTLEEPKFYKGGINWWLVIAIGLVGLCALIAVIVSAVALTKSSKTDVTVISSTPISRDSDSSGSEGGSQGSRYTDGGDSSSAKTYVIQRGHDWGAYEYFDDQGYISGFNQDLINAVCDAAGIGCRIVWDEYTNCWDDEAGMHPFGGEGLFGGWYDACTGWSKTTERLHVFDFSVPYLIGQKSNFFTLPGADFDSSDISGKTIIFIQGWAYNEKCLARNADDNHRAYILDTDRIMYVPGPAQALQALRDRQGDAILGTADIAQPYIDMGYIAQTEGPGFYCTITGNGMMTRKDNDFITHWNRGFAKIQSNGVFKTICANAVDEHGHLGEINCVD